MSDIRIYVMAHKSFEEPKDSIYIPMQVGAALHDSLGYLGDDTGDNISAKNPNYSELTGLYWMWKNGPKCDITGLCHYRRYFLAGEDGTLLGAGDYERILQRYDVVVTEGLLYQQGESVYDMYGEKHYHKDLDLTRAAVEKFYPEYLQAYDEVMQGRGMYYANMMATTQKRLNEYAEWLFTILFEVERNIDMTGYDDYNRRVFGFIAERMVLVWIRHNHLRPFETRVGLMGEKSETREVIEQAGELLLKDDCKNVLKYLEGVKEKRPDLFFKDSDTKGELGELYMFAEIMTAEEQKGKRNLAQYSLDYRKLHELHTGLRKAVIAGGAGLYQYVTDHNISIEFLLVAIQKCLENSEERIAVYNQLATAYLDAGNINAARIYVELALREG